MNETLTRTICIKLDVNGHDAALQETQRHFNEAASWIATVCWHEHITNTNTAHHRVYGETRARFGLGSQLACCARAKAVEAVKATRAKANRQTQASFKCQQCGFCCNADLNAAINISRADVKQPKVSPVCG